MSTMLSQSLILEQQENFQNYPFVDLQLERWDRNVRKHNKAIAFADGLSLKVASQTHI